MSSSSAGSEKVSTSLVSCADMMAMRMVRRTQWPKAAEEDKVS